jgi:branched-chain amino acid transport system ATP-binding protein
VSEPAPLLSVESLQAGYGAVQVLWKISFSVDKGSVVSIIGSNGAGKTTTLKNLAGALRPWSGKITLNGEDITAIPPHERVRRHLVLVPEGRQLWPRMTVEENLLMGAYSVARTRATDNLSRTYELFPRLKERRRQLAGTLSGGEQQMCAIGRGLMSEPEILMLDEPSLGLAPVLVDQIFDMIGSISASGVTILLVEQNVGHALEASDRAYVLETGRIILEGTGRELLENGMVKEVYLGAYG